MYDDLILKKVKERVDYLLSEKMRIDRELESFRRHLESIPPNEILILDEFQSIALIKPGALIETENLNLIVDDIDKSDPERIQVLCHDTEEIPNKYSIHPEEIIYFDGYEDDED